MLVTVTVFVVVAVLIHIVNLPTLGAFRGSPGIKNLQGGRS